MEYHLTLTERPSYLHARATGANNPENALRFLKEAYTACIERKRDALLLEMAFDGPSLAPSSIFGVVSERSADGLKLRKIAYVDASQTSDKARFAETVAMNRGVNVRLFETIADAQKWLEDRSAAR